MDDARIRLTSELRTFWTRPTLEAARDECVMVPPCPAMWDDDVQDAQLADHLSLLDQPSIHIALDYGCGIGRMTRALARRGVYVHAVDVSPEMLEYCRQYLGEYASQVFPHLSDGWGCEDVSSGSCDLVVSFYCLQHMPTREMQQAAVREFERVLRPGGYLIMQTTDHGFDDTKGDVGMIGARITEQGAQQLAEESGLVFCQRRNFPPQQTITVAKKPASSI